MTILRTVIFVAERLIRGNLPDTLAQNDHESRLPFVDLFARETNRVVHSIHSVNVSLAYEMVSKVMLTVLNSDRISLAVSKVRLPPSPPPYSNTQVNRLYILSTSATTRCHNYRIKKCSKQKNHTWLLHSGP